jgi:hypothetical protein
MGACPMPFWEGNAEAELQWLALSVERFESDLGGKYGRRTFNKSLGGGHFH